MTLVLAAGGFLFGVLLGFVGHELAHYAVLQATGHEPNLSLWPPTVDGFTASVPVPLDVRAAAVAPLIVGVVVAAAGLTVAVVEPLVATVAIGAATRFCWLSPQDRDIALGRL